MAAKNKGKARATEVPVEAALPLGKQLAHTDKKIRDHAIANLTAFLSGGGILSLTGKAGDSIQGDSSSKQLLPPLEMRKLWKGLFYCFWMSDKPLVQQRLATDLSNIILSIDPASEDEENALSAKTNAGLDFIAGFWEALVREWAGIDRLRMDKYYMLIRRWQNATFRLLAQSNWSSEALKRYNEILSASIGGPLSSKDPKVSPSISWHLADLWLEELNKVLAEETETPAPLAEILLPFTQLLTCTPNSTTFTRLESAIYQPLLDGLLPAEESEGPAKKRRRTDDDAESPVNLFENIANNSSSAPGRTSLANERELADSVLKSLMSLASLGPETGVKDSNRRKVYNFVRERGGIEDDEE